MADLGGRRAGAGRKPGVANTRTREIAEAAMADGITPLEFMLREMRRPEPVQEEKETPQMFRARWDAWRTVAFDAAKSAAPYIHPRLASVEQFVDAKVRSFAVSDKPLSEDEWDRVYGPLATPGGATESAH